MTLTVPADAHPLTIKYALFRSIWQLTGRAIAANLLMLAPYGYLLAASTFPFFNTAARPETARNTDNPIVMQTGPTEHPPNQDRHAAPVSWGWLVHNYTGGTR